MYESDFIIYLTKNGILEEWRKAIRKTRPTFFVKGVTVGEIKRWRDLMGIPMSDLLYVGFIWDSNSISHLPGTSTWGELSSAWYYKCQGLRRYKANKTIKMRL